MNEKKINRSNHLNGRVKATMVGMLLAAAFVASGFVWANSKIIILVDGKKIQTSALASEPKAVLEASGVFLNSKDEFRVIANEVGKGSTIEVYRAIPVTVVQGQRVEFTLSGKPTVGEIIESLGFSAKSFKPIPAADTRPTPNMQIRLLTLSDKVQEKEMPIPFPSVHQPDSTMEKGLEFVVEAGKPGKKTATVKQMFEDGKEAGFEILSEKILEQPKPEIVRTGTREPYDASRGTIRFKRKLIMEASAYTPFDDGQSGITFTGIPAKRGIVAVDPRVIPLGSRVFVPGYGVALAADTGGYIKGERIDLCIEDYNEAIRFGRRNIEVYILAE